MPLAAASVYSDVNRHRINDHMCNFQLATGAYSFLIFIFFLLVFGAFLWKFLPETKNKTYDEIYRIFNAEGKQPSKKFEDHEVNEQNQPSRNFGDSGTNVVNWLFDHD